MELIIFIANLLVGTLIGISGIAGFLLPITFQGFLGLPMADTLALSFLSFLTSGVLGAWSYHKKGSLDLKLCLPLCLGSLAGALLGVKLNLLIPVGAAKLLLYVVVLASGISVLLKKDSGDGSKKSSVFLEKRWLLALLGFLTAAICSLTGAGGPVLVVPLLAAIGVNLRVAVGVSLLDSVAIALPACAGYFAHTTLPNIVLLGVISVVAHGAGVLLGARLSNRVNLKVLRVLVGALSIGAACYMLIMLFLCGTIG